MSDYTSAWGKATFKQAVFHFGQKARPDERAQRERQLSVRTPGSLVTISEDLLNWILVQRLVAVSRFY